MCLSLLQARVASLQPTAVRSSGGLSDNLSQPHQSAEPSDRWASLTQLDLTCVDCHPQEVSTWRASPMGSSFKLLRDPESESKTSEAQAEYMLYEVTHPLTKTHYQVIDRGGDLVFKQQRGEVSDERVAYAQIGGTHAQTYLWHERSPRPNDLGQGQLFEAPLTRYEGKWDLSPGYEQSDFGLYRGITPGCLHCHAEPTPLSPSARHRYQRLPRSGIGCARCHGDLRAHVEGRYAGRDTPALDLTSLEPARAQEVCDQCHFGGAIRITRAGKTWSDYQPGERLAETIAIFVRDHRAWGLGSVSHRDRLSLSACAQDKTLGCATCHPPHSQRLSDVDAPCRTCHATLKHPQVLTESAQVKRGCVGCHMRREGIRNVPHLSALDHWIRRRPTPEPSAQASEAPLIWSNQPSQNLQDPSYQALLGRAYYKAWRQGGQLSDLRRAYLQLTSGLSASQMDTDPLSAEAWFTLAELTAEVSLSGQLPALRGEVGDRVALDAAERAQRLQLKHSSLPILLYELYLRRGRIADAHRVIQAALALNPRRVDLLRRDAALARSAGKLNEALSALSITREVNPFELRSLFERALTLQTGARWSEARLAFKALLSLAPDWVEAHLNLGWVELQDQRAEQALIAFREAESRGQLTGALTAPLLAQSLSGQALALEANGDLKSALRVADRAVRLGAPAPGMLSLLGRGALAEERAQDALSAFSFATRERPEDGAAWWGLSKAQDLLNDRTSAVESARRASSLGVKEADHWLMRLRSRDINNNQ